MATDAFGRLRISDIFTTFQYYPTANVTSANPATQDYSADTFNLTVSGTTTVGFNNQGYYQLNVAGAGRVIRLSKNPMEYQPGKSRLIYASVIMNSTSNTSGFNSYVGLMNIDATPSITNGIYFQFNGTTLSWNLRTTDSSNVNVTQASWNIDTFDGTGPSGLTLNATSMQTSILIVIDQEWLGVGRVRVGFNINGVNYYAHQFTTQYVYPYTANPRQRIGYYLENTTGTNEMRQVCCVSTSESGLTPLGKRISTGNDVGLVSVPNNTQKYVLFGLKITQNTDYLGGLLKFLNFQSFYPGGNSNQWAKYEIQLHTNYNGTSIGTLTGGTPTFTQINNSIADIYNPVGGSTATYYIASDGLIIHSQLTLNQTGTDLSNSDSDTLLTRGQISYYDTLYVVAQINTGTNQLLGCSIDFIETI